MSIEWIEYKGKKILYIKYGDMDQSKMLDQIKEATKTIVSSGSSEILSLSDLTGCYINEAFLELTKSESKTSLPLTKKAAVVGIIGIKKLLLNAVNAFTIKARKPFDTIEEAKEWLTAD
jgi:hypothetical protein